MKISVLQRNVVSIIKNIDEFVLESAMQNENHIVDFNTDQLSQGLRSDNKPIEPEYYFGEYAKMKKAMGSKAPEGTPDLYYTGDFYSGLYAQKTKDWIEIHSTDWKEKKLALKYGEIMGLNKRHMSELGQYSLPFLLKKLRNEIHTS
jgi:hypothetical protein